MNKEYFLGIDVGTGSARAGLFDKKGAMISSASHSIKIWKPEKDFVQQSSENIWQAVCATVKKALEKADVDPEHVRGIGFDATCSLVLLDEENHPVSVYPDGVDEQNIIVWMDHRAKEEAKEINQKGHEVLKYVGGIISPEMQTPKLLWLKRNMPLTWGKTARFFDLPDFLVYRSTGDETRSACTTTCKWTYLCHENSKTDDSIGRWEDSYFNEIGLADLVREEYKRIGQKVRPVGKAAGNGLTENAAIELGLKTGTPVSISIIDAHAGGIGLLGMSSDSKKKKRDAFEEKIALIGGTSSCHMAVQPLPAFIKGIWGPYYSAMLPGYWLNEGGQSATGALIDHIIFTSHLGDNLNKRAADENRTVYDILNERIVKMQEDQNLDDPGLLTKNLHVLPYFHGNRSPRANPSLAGSICGLSLSSTIDDLALIYLATIQAIACGTRHIIETLNEKGYSIQKIMATGGGTKNEIFLKSHADICGCEIILPQEKEAVLLGSAILGSVASGIYSDIFEAMEKMSRIGDIIQPKEGVLKMYHNLKYEVFHKMYRDERSYYKIMQDGL